MDVCTVSYGFIYGELFTFYLVDFHVKKLDACTVIFKIAGYEHVINMLCVMNCDWMLVHEGRLCN